MNKAVAKSTYIRMSPRKLRLVADAVRGQEAEAALTNLQFVNKRAAKPLNKVLRQAVANAKQLGLSSPLKISQLMINKGPVYKRWRAVSRGQAHGIEKFTSHILIELSSSIKSQITEKQMTNKGKSKKLKRKATSQK